MVVFERTIIHFMVLLCGGCCGLARQVTTLREQLNKLRKEQSSSGRRVSQMTDDLQKSSLEYELSLQKDQKKQAEESEKALKQELARVTSAKGKGSSGGSSQSSSSESSAPH